MSEVEKLREAVTGWRDTCAESQKSQQRSGDAIGAAYHRGGKEAFDRVLTALAQNAEQKAGSNQLPCASCGTVMVADGIPGTLYCPKCRPRGAGSGPTSAAVPQREHIGKDGRSHFQVSSGDCICGWSILNRFEWQRHLDRECAVPAGESEFVDDVDACLAYIHKKISTLQEIAKNAALRANRAAQPVAEPLREAGKLRELLESCMTWTTSDEDAAWQVIYSNEHKQTIRVSSRYDAAMVHAQIRGIVMDFVRRALAQSTASGAPQCEFHGKPIEELRLQVSWMHKARRDEYGPMPRRGR